MQKETHQHRKSQPGKTPKLNVKTVRPSGNNDPFPEKTFDKNMRYIACYVEALLTDIHNNQTLRDQSLYSFTDLQMDIRVLHRRANCEGLGFLTKSIPSLVSSFFLYLETGESVYSGFAPYNSKACPNAMYPRFLRGLMAPIYENSVNDATATVLIQSIYQIGSLFKKLRGPYSEDVLVDFVDGFIDLNEGLKEIDLRQPDTTELIEMMRFEITDMFKDFHPEDPYNRYLFVPRPGPGAVYHPLKANKRFEAHVMYDSINNSLPISEWFYISRTDAWDDGENLRKLIDYAVKEPSSEFGVVPKTFAKPRGICKEVNEVQVMQQAFRRAIYHLAARHPYTAGHCNFNDQSINRELALLGSRTRCISTLDMEGGSDRVLKELVYQSFIDTPILPYLMALSTNYIDLPPYAKMNYVESMMYAPMGSALCFPIMGLIHYFMLRAIARKHFPQKFKEYSRQIYVFGDDLIVPTAMTEAVFADMPKFGMKLNRNKSFAQSEFRESCGLHAYKGKEITPLFIKAIPNKQDSSIESLHSAVAAEWGLRSRGYVKTASMIRSHTEKIHGPLLDVGLESGVLGWRHSGSTDPYLQKNRIRRRWHWDNHSWEYKVPTIVPVEPELLPLDDGILSLKRYLWLSGISSRFTTDLMSKDVTKEMPIIKVPSEMKETYKFKIIYRWVLASAL